MTGSVTDNRPINWWTRIIMMVLFGAAMGYLEAAVVVYLRALFYPNGFVFPLQTIPHRLLVVELFREAATLVMLLAVAHVAGRRRWERFGYFLILFGIWDIFYYLWLKAAIDWPASLGEWDILFLLPWPWIGPVIAPILISALMIAVGWAITVSYARGREFRPTTLSWLLSLAATAVILYSFMYDTAATLHQQLPRPYPYALLLLGLALYAAAFGHAVRRSTTGRRNDT